MAPSSSPQQIALVMGAATGIGRAGKQALEDAKQAKIDAKNEAAEGKLIVQQALNL